MGDSTADHQEVIDDTKSCCQPCVEMITSSPPTTINSETTTRIMHESTRRIIPDRLPIGVIGTGNAAVAITKRLLTSGYSVVIGSRKPTLRHATLTQLGHCLCGAELTSIAECIRRCEIIVVAIHMENFRMTLEHFSHLSRGKILVDMSNRETRYVARSNAEYLSSILPEAEVVKAFNTISASVMENRLDTSMEGHKVFVSCDNEKVRNKVLDLSRSMGFHAVDFGGLKNSLHIEDFVLKVFTHWKIPLFITLGIFNLWSLYIVYIYFIDKTAYEWEQIFLKILNKPLCMTAMTTLALTYLPGQIASMVQVCRGTKHSRFPRLLDTWLKSRKQFGLITFGLACFHVIASTLMLSPTYYRSWFHQPTVTTIQQHHALPMMFPQHSGIINNITSSSSSSFSFQNNLSASSGVTSTAISMRTQTLPVSTSWMVWKGELALLFGISAFLTMSIQAVTSLQSVATSLNWSEWQCVQSKMGTGVLILASCHVFSMGIPGWLKVGPVKTLGTITFLSLILPLVVLALKLVFRFTPLYCYLRKIRKGWERDNNNSNRDEEGQNMTSDKMHNLHKQKYRPLSSRRSERKPPCRGTEEEEEEERVGLNTDRDDGDVGHLEISGGLQNGGKRCCCRGNSKNALKNSVRFASNTKCACSAV